MEKTAAGNGMRNSSGIRAVGRIRGKINRQTGDNTSETPAQNDQTQDNGYQYDSDTGNGTQDNIQQWNGVQQNNTDWNNSSQWNNNSQNNNVQNNNAQNNNVQSNNARNNNSAWNAQPQTDNNMQITSRTDNESAVKISEKPTPTSIPVPTPKPAKNPKPTKTPKSTQPPTPKLSKKKNKKKQNKAKKTEKENKNTGNSKVFQNKENQGDTVEYTHVKDEAVKFHCTQNTDSFHTPRIQIISRGSVQILSFRLNKTECPWHWEGDWIIPDTEDENVKEIELLVISQGGKLIKMNPRIFSS